MRRANPRPQGGFALIPMMIAVMIFTILLVQAAQFMRFKLNLDNAEAVGHRIAMYNSAVASYLNAEPARLGALSQPFPTGVQNGVSWLQAPPCAGATGAVPYLSCGFNDFLPYNLGPYTTNIVAAGAFYTATTNLGWAVTGLNPDRVVGGQIVNAASAYRTSYTTNAETASGFMAYDIDPPSGTITATVDTAALGDRWLRLNGTNAMGANLNFGGYDGVNARDLNANRDLIANRNTNAGQDVNATRNMNAGQDMSATRDHNAGRNMNANAAGAGGNVNVAGTAINLAETLQSPHFVHDGDLLDKPQCPPDKPVPRVFAIPGMFASTNQTDPVTGVVPSVVDAGTRWQIGLAVATINNPGGTAGNPNSAALVSTICTN